MAIFFSTETVYPIDLKEISKKHSETVVRIKTNKSTGTGFFINEFGTIVTCLHVVDDADKIEVKWNDETFNAIMTHGNYKADQAVIQMLKNEKAASLNTPYIKIGADVVDTNDINRLGISIGKKMIFPKIETLDTVMVMGYKRGPVVHRGRVLHNIL